MKIGEKEGKSNRKIASLVGKTPQTVHTEIKREIVLLILNKSAKSVNQALRLI